MILATLNSTQKQAALFWGALCSLGLLGLFNFYVPALWKYKKDMLALSSGSIE